MAFVMNEVQLAVYSLTEPDRLKVQAEDMSTGSIVIWVLPVRDDEGSAMEVINSAVALSEASVDIINAGIRDVTGEDMHLRGRAIIARLDN